MAIPPTTVVKELGAFVPYVTSGPLIPSAVPPAVVHAPGVRVWTGPMWSVAVADVHPKEAVAAHVAALLCEPNKEKAQRRARAVAGLSRHRRGGKAAGIASGELPIPGSFPMGWVKAGRLYMPPSYAAAAFPGALVVGTDYVKGERARPAGFAQTLRPNQAAALTAYARHVAANPAFPGAVIVLPCGEGKTFAFMAAAAALGFVALVIMPTKALVEQWIYGCRESMPGLRVGYVRAGGPSKVRIHGVDIIIATIQSILAHLDDPDSTVTPVLKARVGLLCMDEGHHAIARTFAQVWTSLPAYLRIVLTATPRRSDGLMPHLLSMTGPVVFRAFRKLGEAHCVHVCYAPKDPHAHIVLRDFAGQRDHTGMVNALAADTDRNGAAIAIVAAMVAQGRRVLVVVPRKEQVDAIADGIADADMPALAAPHSVVLKVYDDPPKRRKRKGETDDQAQAALRELVEAWEDTGPHFTMVPAEAPAIGRFKSITSQTKEARLNQLLQLQGTVVVATDDIMAEGVDVPHLDTLVLLSEIRDAEQVLGRILRSHPDKRVPVVFEFWMPLFESAHDERMQRIRDQGFLCTTMTVSGFEDVPAPDHPGWARFDKVASAGDAPAHCNDDDDDEDADAHDDGGDDDAEHDDEPNVRKRARV